MRRDPPTKQLPLGPENSGKAPATVSPDSHQPGQRFQIFAFARISLPHYLTVSPKHCAMVLPRILLLCHTGGPVPRVTAYLQKLLFSRRCVSSLHGYEAMRKSERGESLEMALTVIL